jgi:hypothetical protein
MYDLTFGVGVTMFAIIGGILLIMGIVFKDKAGSMAKPLAVVGALALVFAGVTYVSGIYQPVSEEIIPGATYDVSCTEAEAELSVNSVDHTITWIITYDESGNAFTNSSGAGTLNFTVAWASGDEGPVSLGIGAVPFVDQSGASDIALVDENSDGTYNCLWHKLNSAGTAQITAYEDINLYIEVADSEWSNVVITLDATAGATPWVSGTSEGAAWSMPITVAGEVWTINFVITDVCP